MYRKFDLENWDLFDFGEVEEVLEKAWRRLVKFKLNETLEKLNENQINWMNQEEKGEIVNKIPVSDLQISAIIKITVVLIFEFFNCYCN